MITYPTQYNNMPQDVTELSHRLERAPIHVRITWWCNTRVQEIKAMQAAQLDAWQMAKFKQFQDGALLKRKYHSPDV